MVVGCNVQLLVQDKGFVAFLTDTINTYIATPVGVVMRHYNLRHDFVNILALIFYLNPLFVGEVAELIPVVCVTHVVLLFMVDPFIMHIPME